MPTISNLCLIISVLLIMPTGTLLAQPDYPAPSGIWCSCPPSSGMGTGSVVPAVAEKEYVEGILLRVVWRDLEPTDNEFNWSIIDDQLAAAASYDKKISLAIGGGPKSPDWLFELGTSSFSFEFPFEGTIPILWDSIYIAQWTHLIQELGTRYKDNTTIQLVYMTTATSNGFEMQLPSSPTPSYDEVAYTELKVIDTWKLIINEFNSAFPNHYLTNDFHPVNGSHDIGDSVYLYANNTIGDRYGANAWWWTQNNTEVYSEQFEILQNSTMTNDFSGIQMAKSGIASPEIFGPGGLPVALELAIENNVCYWEIWNADIVDGSFDSLFTAATCVNSSSIDENAPAAEISIYPNPSNGRINIATSTGFIERILIYDAIGNLLVDKITNLQNNHQIELHNHCNSFVFIKVFTSDGNVISKKIILIQ